MSPDCQRPVRLDTASDDQESAIPSGCVDVTLFDEGFGSADPPGRSSVLTPTVHRPSLSSVDTEEAGSSKTRRGRSGGGQLRLLHVNPESNLGKKDIAVIRLEYSIPEDIEIKIPSKSERIDMDENDWLPMYLFPFKEGFRFPFPPLMSTILNHFEIAPCQLMPNAWRVLLSLCRFPELFKEGVDLNEHDSDRGRIKIVVRSSDRKLVTGMTDNYRHWKYKYVFFKGRGMFSEDTPLFPSAWRPFNKDYNKSPNLSQASKDKINRLLGLPAADRHFKQVLRKANLFCSSLWKSVRQGLTSDNIIENMSYKIPAASEVRKGARAKLDQMPTGKMSVNKTTSLLNESSHKRQRVEADIDEGFKALRISESGNVFVDPSSIDGYIDDLSTEEEDKFLKDLGDMRIAEDAVTNNYRALLETVALRRAVRCYINRIKNLKKEREAMVEEMTTLKEQASQVKRLQLDLGKEKKTVQELTKELDDMALKCSVKARGVVMLEYQRERTDRWLVQEDVELFSIYFPKEYEEMVNQLDLEGKDLEGKVNDQEGHSEADDKSKPVEDELD